MTRANGAGTKSQRRKPLNRSGGPLLHYRWLCQNPLPRLNLANIHAFGLSLVLPIAEEYLFPFCPLAREAYL